MSKYLTFLIVRSDPCNFFRFRELLWGNEFGVVSYSLWSQELPKSFPRDSEVEKLDFLASFGFRA